MADWDAPSHGLHSQRIPGCVYGPYEHVRTCTGTADKHVPHNDGRYLLPRKVSNKYLLWSLLISLCCGSDTVIGPTTVPIADLPLEELDG